MVYIPPNSVFDPGVVLGDAKTIETRGVYIEVDGDGYPVDKGLVPGAACWIEHVNGIDYARPYPEYDPTKQSFPNPFGIVLRVYARDPAKPYQLNQNENTAVVAVSGTVGLRYTADPYSTVLWPRLGDRVTPYGTRIGEGTMGLPSVGICDGISGEKDNNLVIAVRLDVHGEALSSSTFGQPLIATCQADGEIAQYAWVYTSGTQPEAREHGLVVVKAYDNAGQNKHIYGLALDAAQAGAELRVLYYGIGYTPYIYWQTAKLAGLDTANGGKMPTMFKNRIVRNDGTVGEVLTTIITVGTLIGTAVEVGGSIYRMIKGGSSPAKCFDNIPSGSVRFQQLLAAENGVFSVPPDGYQGLFVNTNLMGPATLTEAPVLLDTPQRDANGNILIREGHIYAGSNAGVKEITADNVSGVSFYGVSAPVNTEDQEVNPPVPPNDPSPEVHIRVIREGIANVEAKSNWTQGAYIDLLGKQIPEDEEEFVPHIGKALETTALGRFGAVDIRPFDPNQYIIVDHCKLQPIAGHNFGIGSSVYTDVSSTIGFVHTNIYLAEADADYLYHGVTGVLTRYDPGFYGSDEYDGRAIIQISGYIKCNPTAANTLTAGMKVQRMENHTAYAFVSESALAGEYTNILGILMKTQTADLTDQWWVILEPRTQLVSPNSANEADKQQE